jgi:glycosyltransferase involved in cell wall biosynthesis
MKVSGFTFVRNGELLGYPFIESIKSLLAVCDEVIVAVGESEDDTLNKIKQINDSKLRIIETKWNEGMADRGYVYAQQKMIAQFNCSGDWAFYLEGDEIIHEKDYVHIRQQMEQHLHNKEIEALVFDYHHFYGSPKHEAISPRWYKKAPRIIRNTIRSWAPDGLFWVIMDENKKGRYPKAALMKCYIYHYGHVRSIAKMDEKNKRVEKYWGKQPGEFITYGNIDHKTIFNYTGTHPSIIKDWLLTSAEQDFTPNTDYKLTSRDKKHRIVTIIAKMLNNKDFSKKHFILNRR